MLTLGINSFVVGGLIVMFVIVCVLLMLTVLIQRPSGGGLSGAFGSGAGSGQTAFGAKTGDALTIATIIMFVMYLGLAVGLNYATKPTIVVGTQAGPGETPAENGTTGQPQQPVDPAAGNQSGAPVPGTTEPGQTAPQTPPGETPPAGTNPPANPPAEPPPNPAPVAPPG